MVNATKRNGKIYQILHRGKGMTEIGDYIPLILKWKKVEELIERQVSEIAYQLVTFFFIGGGYEDKTK